MDEREQDVHQRGACEERVEEAEEHSQPPVRVPDHDEHGVVAEREDDTEDEVQSEAALRTTADFQGPS
jgi:hypothetical protein